MLVLRNQIHLLAETHQIGHEQISTLKVSAVILQLNLMSISDKKSDLQTQTQTCVACLLGINAKQ